MRRKVFSWTVWQSLDIGGDLGTNVSDADFREYIKSKYRLWTWDGTNAGVPAVLQQGATETDNMNLTVSVSPAGTNKDILPLPAGMNVAT